MQEVHVALAAEKIFGLGPIPVTNSILTTWIVTLLLISFAFFATRKIAAIPQGLQNVAESAIEIFQDLVSSIAGDKSKVFLPIITTFFFFILFGNYLGLLPGVGSIGFWEQHNKPEVTKVTKEPNETKADKHETSGTSGSSVTSDSSSKTFVPLFRSINSDLNTTAALAIVSLVITHYYAIRYLGLGHYIAKFISLNPIFLFVGILELIGEATKILSLSFRLFGNIFAGEVLLTTTSTRLFAFIVPIPFYFLELLVGFVQALIFAMLTLVFMVILTQKSGH